MTASKIYKGFKTYLDNYGHNYYKPYKEEKVLQLSATLNSTPNDESTNIVILIKCDDFFAEITAYLEHSADEKSCAGVMEYLTRVNYNLKQGNFCIDLRDDGLRKCRNMLHTCKARLQ